MSLSSAGEVRDCEVAVVIVNYRTPELTMGCLDSLSGEKELVPKLRAVVVDGGSGDCSAAELSAGIEQRQYRGWVSFLPLAINGGFGWANNQAILTLAHSKRPPAFIYLLNPDTQLLEGAAFSLLRELNEHPECGAAGSQLLTPDGRHAASAFRFPTAGRELVNAAQSEILGRLLSVTSTVIRADRGAEVDWVTGASVMLRTQALCQTGLFDDGFFLYFEEVELMHRMRAKGWTVRHVPESRVVHVEGAATGLGEGSHGRPLPPYWYESRRRYFALTQGKAGLLGANLGWFAGRAAWLGKRALGKSNTGNGTRTADLLRFALWPRSRDTKASAPALGDAPGKQPGWMKR